MCPDFFRKQSVSFDPKYTYFLIMHNHDAYSTSSEVENKVEWLSSMDIPWRELVGSHILRI